MTTTCARCERPTPDGYACTPCTDRARRQLADIIDMTPAARDIAQRQAVHGTGAGGGGKPGSTLPLDLGATARLDGVQATLTTWARHIGEIRGVEITRPPAVRPVSGPTCRTPYACQHGSCRALREPLRPLDEIQFAAGWLASHCEWMRHRPEIDQFLTDIDAGERIVRSLARGPAAQRYLGPCGTSLIAEFAEGLSDTERCEGDVYGPDGATSGWCRTCGQRYDQATRLAELATLTADRAYRAAHIAHAHGIPVNTIRSWAHRGRLRSWWFDGEEMQLWTENGETEEDLKARGPRLHVVADVLALHQADTERRAARHHAQMGA